MLEIIFSLVWCDFRQTSCKQCNKANKAGNTWHLGVHRLIPHAPQQLKHTSPHACCHPGPRARRGWGGSGRRWRGDRERAWRRRWCPSWGVCAPGPGSHPAECGGKSPSSPRRSCLQHPGEGRTTHPGPRVSRTYPMRKNDWGASLI